MYNLLINRLHEFPLTLSEYKTDGQDLYDVLQAALKYSQQIVEVLLETFKARLHGTPSYCSKLTQNNKAKPMDQKNKCRK